MPATWTAIRRIEVGGVSLISADKANELIDAINYLASMTVNPAANVGAFKMGAPAAILDLTLLDNRLSNVEQRLDNANIIGQCVGNTINITLTI